MTGSVNNSGTIALLGGTGDLGGALARRWAKAGLSVVIGSRSVESAERAAALLSTEIGRLVGSGGNVEVAAEAEIVVVTVPFAAQEATLLSVRDVVQGKLVVDATVPASIIGAVISHAGTVLIYQRKPPG